MNAHTKRPARAVLRAAIEARDVAAAREREAAAALGRADQSVARARLRLHQVRDVDAEILAHNAAAYRTHAVVGGDPPAADVPPHLAEKRGRRDACAAELAAAKAAQAQLAGEHAAAQTEHQRCDRAVAEAADAVVADMSLLALGRYALAIRAARAAWADVAAIAGMTVQTGLTWAERAPLPGLPDGLVDTVARGFGYQPEPIPGQAPPARSAVWEDLRRRLRDDAGAELR
jgi:hypothetical protein